MSQLTRRAFVAATAACSLQAAARTELAIDGGRFLINNKPTYAGISWKGNRVEGLLLNARMVQGIFDDRNSETVGRWKYPDTGMWDPDRNTREFVAAMPEWRAHGLLSFTICLQGGSPEGYSKAQPWNTGAFRADGTLIPEYLNRLRHILEKADELGMAPIVSLFYFGQDQRVENEKAVRRAVKDTVSWLLSREYRNVLLDLVNECDVASYDHEVLKPDLIPLLIRDVKDMTLRGRRLLVSTSFKGNSVPTADVAAAADFILMHGNGVKEPKRIAAMVRSARKLANKPILFNEDDHFDFDKPDNNFTAALSEYASWGYFDPGESDYKNGYQCPPVNWGINTPRKAAYFKLLKEITSSQPDR